MPYDWRLADYYFTWKGNCQLCDKAVARNNFALASHLRKHVREGELTTTLRGHTTRYALTKVDTLVHKTCPTWGQTNCKLGIFTLSPPKTTLRWNEVTCPKCLTERPVKK